MTLTKTQTVLYRKYFEMTKLLNLYLNHFPKHEKYALCTIIRNTNYSLYDLVVEATKRYHKKTTLQNIDITHEKLRMQIYLAYELNYFNFKDGVSVTGASNSVRYSKINKKINELGRLIGAWIKTERGRNG